MASVDFPDNVVVLGGGRWSRVYLGVLCGLLPATCRVWVCTPRNLFGMRQWLDTQGFRQRVVVGVSQDDFVLSGSCAVFVVNAARDHAAALRWATARGFPVLVEKPVTASTSQSLALLQEMERAGHIVAISQIFRFARHVCLLTETAYHDVRSVRIQWVNATADTRHGEVAAYDAALSVVADSLPHVLPILDALIGHQAVRWSAVTVTKGGANVTIFGESESGARCQITLGRNANRRERCFALDHAAGFDVLDFADEPGVLTRQGVNIDTDPLWEELPGPLSCMLVEFLANSSARQVNKKLAPAGAIRALMAIGVIEQLYDAALLDWLRQENSPEVRWHPDLAYAFTELLLLHKRHDQQKIDSNLEELSALFSRQEMDVSERREAQKKIDLFIKGLATRHATNYLEKTNP